MRVPPWSLPIAVMAALLFPGSTAATSSRAEPLWTLEGISEICLAEVIDFQPAAEPTPEARYTYDAYRLRVTHVWKGEPKDTLYVQTGNGRAYSNTGRHGSIANVCGPSIRLAPGDRCLVYLGGHEEWYPSRENTIKRVRPLPDAIADLYHLQRTGLRFRSVCQDCQNPPSVSIRSLLRDLESLDSLAQASAILALGELQDSVDVSLEVALRVVASTPRDALRRAVCDAVECWAVDHRRARLAYGHLLRDESADNRLAAVWSLLPGGAPDPEGILIHLATRDPDLRVREAAARRLSGNRKSMRARNVLIGLASDSSRVVRAAAADGLGTFSADSATVTPVLRRLAGDADPEVARRARGSLNRVILIRGAGEVAE